MTLARSLTKRLGRSDSNASAIETPNRSFSQRKTIKPGQISLPINLLSTTNMMSYEAPDVSIMQKATRASVEPNTSSPQSRTSSEDATPTLTDGSSVESSPTVEYNHLSCYFPGPTLKRSQSAQAMAKSHSEAPALPKRAPSHSKREHERMARKRSIRSSTGSTPVSEKSSPTTSIDPAFAAAVAEAVEQDTPPSIASPPPANPFSHELERLNEVAEEFVGVASGWEAEEDAVVMKRKGLSKVAAEEYLSIMDSMWMLSPYIMEEATSPDDYIGCWI